MAAKGRRLALADAAALVHPRDTIAMRLRERTADGPPRRARRRATISRTSSSTRVCWSSPTPSCRTRRSGCVSAFFGPIERMARAAGVPGGAPRRRLPRSRARRTAAAPARRAGGDHAAGRRRLAQLRDATPARPTAPFVDAARDPDRLAIAEVNPHMPRRPGFPEHGDNRIHVSEVDAWVEHDARPRRAAARAAVARRTSPSRATPRRSIEDGATLQFGIGAVPDEIAGPARRRPGGRLRDPHRDDLRRRHGAAPAGKVTNRRKGLYDGYTVATFALGGADLYAWLDGNADVRMLPVSAVNDPALLRQLRRFVSINGALAIDLLRAGRGRLHRRPAVLGRRRRRVVRHGRVRGAGREEPALPESTATVHGRRISTIVPRLGADACVTTPRHHVQWVVTEHGAADLSVLERPRAGSRAHRARPSRLPRRAGTSRPVRADSARHEHRHGRIAGVVLRGARQR